MGLTHAKAKCRSAALSPQESNTRSFSGASRRTFLGEEGSGSMVNPQRRILRRRRTARSGAARVSRRDWLCDRQEISSSWARFARPAASWFQPGRSKATAIPPPCIAISPKSQWPPRSGKIIEIPEVDRGAWFSLQEARDRTPAESNDLSSIGSLRNSAPILIKAPAHRIGQAISFFRIPAPRLSAHRLIGRPRTA